MVETGKNINCLYPYKDLPAVQSAWMHGHHPLGCKGVCKVVGAGGIEVCHGCGWDEYDGIIEMGDKTINHENEG